MAHRQASLLQAEHILVGGASLCAALRNGRLETLDDSPRSVRGHMNYSSWSFSPCQPPPPSPTPSTQATVIKSEHPRETHSDSQGQSQRQASLPPLLHPCQAGLNEITRKQLKTQPLHRAAQKTTVCGQPHLPSTRPKFSTSQGAHV